MNKIIKYRAWNKDFQEMIYDSNERIFSNYLEEDLMQYTGLKDKNGVSIYEGDIVEEDWVLGKSKTYYKPIEITWNQHICAFCTGSKPLQFPIRWVVIGNIYENPELLDNK